jgi:hypothetical protein
LKEGFPPSQPLGLAKPAKTPYHDDQGSGAPVLFIVWVQVFIKAGDPLKATG